MKPKDTGSLKKKKNRCILKVSNKTAKEEREETNYQHQRRGASATDPAAIKRVRWEPYKQRYMCKFEHFAETNQSLENYKLSNSAR